MCIISAPGIVDGQHRCDGVWRWSAHPSLHGSHCPSSQRWEQTNSHSHGAAVDVTLFIVFVCSLSPLRPRACFHLSFSSLISFSAISLSISVRVSFFPPLELCSYIVSPVKHLISCLGVFSLSALAFNLWLIVPLCVSSHFSPRSRSLLDSCSLFGLFRSNHATQTGL